MGSLFRGAGVDCEGVPLRGNPWAKARPSMERTGGGYVTAVVRGDVAAVKAAVDAGVRGAEKVGEVIATHVIARPHVNIDMVLPLGRQESAEDLA